MKIANSFFSLYGSADAGRCTEAMFIHQQTHLDVAYSNYTSKDWRSARFTQAYLQSVCGVCCKKIPSMLLALQSSKYFLDNGIFFTK
jgi:hypothetical protein